MTIRSGLFILLAPGLSQGASAQSSVELGDAEEGRKVAQEHCLECHVPNGSGAAASLAAIAHARGMTSLALSVWFNSPHPTMPNFILFRETQEDLIAYIRSVKK